MTAKQRVAALRGGQLDDLVAPEVGCGRISLRRTSMKRKIAPNDPGIWGMSVDNFIDGTVGKRLTYKDLIG